MALSMFSTFNATDVKFSDIRKNAKGGKAVYLNSNAGQKLIFQLPALRQLRLRLQRNLRLHRHLQ